MRGGKVSDTTGAACACVGGKVRAWLVLAPAAFYEQRFSVLSRLLGINFSISLLGLKKYLLPVSISLKPLLTCNNWREKKKTFHLTYPASHAVLVEAYP